MLDATEFHPTRRTLLAGAAWAAPVVVMAAAAPLVVASPAAAALVVNGNLHQSSSDPFTHEYTISLYSSGSPGYHLTNEVEGYSITNATLTFWYPENGLCLTSSGGGWSDMTPTGASQVSGGITYYAYESTNSGAYATTNGTTTLPAYQFDTKSTFVSPQPSAAMISATAYSGTALLTYQAGPFSKV